MKSLFQTLNHQLALVFFLSVILILSVILSYLIFEDAPLVYKNVPFPLESREMISGMIPAYQVIRCNITNKAITYTVYQKIQSLDYNFTSKLGSTRVVVDPGCHSAFMLIAPLPNDLTPGYYRLVGYAEVQGDMRMHFVEWHTRPFVIN